ncbi:Glutathione peroxidase 1 [Trichoplax sp. H2]|nr:Glutathione peroxidase 1 [Trichoplax sp. H2]|eukprot:RDD43055.1 Glutathione peroxidase 1 [Trichoplax sp. H2]
MNQLLAKYAHQGNGFAVLAFPCNQFGHQENLNGEEILHSLKHVRPGGGYQPDCVVMDKCDVNGSNAHPLFQFLKESLPTPSDDADSLMSDPKFIIWKPVKRSDISWNFEKFLITADGKPYKRYSRNFRTEAIANDIEHLLSVASKKGRK